MIPPRHLFPNEASLLRLVSAVLMEISEEWETVPGVLRPRAVLVRCRGLASDALPHVAVTATLGIVSTIESRRSIACTRPLSAADAAMGRGAIATIFKPLAGHELVEGHNQRRRARRPVRSPDRVPPPRAIRIH